VALRWGRRWARLPAYSHEKYCHKGGMALAHQHRSGWFGVQEHDHGPFRRSPENAWFAGKKPYRVRGPCPLGAAMDSSAFLANTRSTATTGA
jgi:hypothetical protein